MSWAARMQKIFFIFEITEVHLSLPALLDVICKEYTNEPKKGAVGMFIEKYRGKFPDAEKQKAIKNVICKTNFR